MNKFLFATAMAVGTMAAAPAMAWDGYLGASASHTEAEISSVDADAESYSVFGAGVAPLAEGFSLQYDARITFPETDGGEDDTIFNGGLHLISEQEDGRFGAFVGVTTSDADNSSETWEGGIEAQANVDKYIFGGALGYFTNDDVELDGWGLRLDAQKFKTDNFVLGARFGLATAEVFDVDVDGWTAGVWAEYQLTDTPISFSAGYDRTEIKDFDVEADTISLGVTYNFSGTLRDRETTGPSLNGLGLVGIFNY